MGKITIPYSTHSISQKDIDAVTDVLQSGWLTGGQAVELFEKGMAEYCQMPYCSALSSGTAGLHAAVHAIGIQPGDEVIVPTLSFVATANAVVYEGGTPVFCDVMESSLTISPEHAERLITPKTKAIICMDYAGQLCDYDSLNKLAEKHNLLLIADSCHSLGASKAGKMSGSFADLSVFSFHPVKHITTGEGGMVVSSNSSYKDKINRFRNHGMSSDPRQRERNQAYEYTIDELGWNYRLTDIQSALGLSQLKKIDSWVQERRKKASYYDEHFKNSKHIKTLAITDTESHSHHLYVVKVDNRRNVFSFMRAKGIGVNVHYPPIHLHNYYQRRFNTAQGMCPVAENAYDSILSLPLYPDLTDKEQHFVVKSLTEVTSKL